VEEGIGRPPKVAWNGEGEMVKRVYCRYVSGTCCCNPRRRLSSPVTSTVPTVCRLGVICDAILAGQTSKGRSGAGLGQVRRPWCRLRISPLGHQAWVIGCRSSHLCMRVLTRTCMQSAAITGIAQLNARCLRRCRDEECEDAWRSGEAWNPIKNAGQG
jgi:hypothetical protein